MSRVDETSRPSKRIAWARARLVYLPVVLLLVNAAHHFVLVRAYVLNPWLGAGFGMFSSTDGGASRHLHVFARTLDGEKELEIPDRLDDLEDRVRGLASPRRIRRLVRAMATLAGPPSATVRIELWRTVYDAVTMRPESRLLLETQFDVEPIESR